MNEELIMNISNEELEKQREVIQSKNYANDKRINFNEKNYLNVRLGKNENNKVITIRILPISATCSNVFEIIKTHTLKVDKQISKSGFKQFICLNNNQIKNNNKRGCPLCQKSQEYFDASKNASSDEERKALVKLGYSFAAKNTFIIRVIERGHESDGPKFWKFNSHNDGNGVYDKLMNIYEARKQESQDATGVPYSIFDLKEGRDIKINLSCSDKTNRTTIDIIDSGFSTPLSTDIKLANSWISDAKIWQNVYGVKTYDYLKIIGDNEIPYFDANTNTFVPRIKNEGSNPFETEVIIAKEAFKHDDINENLNVNELPF